MIKLNTLVDWATLEPGKQIPFRAPANKSGARKVRLNLNCAEPTVLYLQDEFGVRLLTAVPAGLEVVEFSHGGDFAIFGEEEHGAVQFLTKEGEPPVMVDVDPQSFTKVLQRKARNPELEAIRYEMLQGQMRREADMQAGFAAQLEAIKSEIKNAATPAPVEPKAAAKAMAPAVDRGKPATGEPNGVDDSETPVEPNGG